MCESVIVVENLTRCFGNGTGKKTAVNGISFEVKKGEIFGVLGPNGAGKTTTIKMLCSLLKPSGGRATVLGIDVNDDRETKNLRKRINVVSGGERGLYYRLSGRQNLRFFADLYGVPPKERERRVNDTLELVGMSEDADRKVEGYSRGMKQRIHIAKSLINDPEILFLDEPTIGLDPEMSLHVRKIIRELASKGKTIILTTHYMFEAEELCDRMVLLKHGNIVGYGGIEELKAKVSDDTMIRIVTTSDPSSVIPESESITDVRFETISGRYVVSIRCRKDADVIGFVEKMYADFGIRSIGYDEPTMEDTYLYLTGGD